MAQCYMVEHDRTILDSVSGAVEILKKALTTIIKGQRSGVALHVLHMLAI